MVANSLVEQERILAEVYFPRLIVPTAAMLACLVDFAIAFVVLLGMMLVYGIVPSTAILTLPFFVAFAALTALAISLWLSALNVLYRDVRYTIPFMVQLLKTLLFAPERISVFPVRYGPRPRRGSGAELGRTCAASHYGGLLAR